MTPPDPIVVTIGCPDPDCTLMFPATGPGADAYRTHWTTAHAPVHTVRREPVLSGTARVTKADGTTFEVPLEFAPELTAPGG